MLLSAQLLADIEGRAAADERCGRWPMMQAQHDTSYYCGYAGDLRQFSDENQFYIWHFLLRGPQ